MHATYSLSPVVPYVCCYSLYTTLSFSELNHVLNIHLTVETFWINLGPLLWAEADIEPLAE